MQPLSLETLLLADDKLEAARIQVQEMAYFKWQDAGCPENRSDEFWNEAELEWIEYYYVPEREYYYVPKRASNLHLALGLQNNLSQSKRNNRLN